MGLYVNSGYRLVIDSAGQVGIGTTDPDELVHIQKDQNAPTVLKIENKSVPTGTLTDTVIPLLVIQDADSTGVLIKADSGTATSTVEIGKDNSASGLGACLKLRDHDDGGWTYCVVLDGAITCSTVSCQ